MKIIKLINAIFYTLAILVLILAVMPYLRLPNRIRIYAVASQSMFPTLSKGDLIVVREEEKYEENNIITFSNPISRKKSETITHRITKVEEKDNATIYKTKGDANNTEDGWELKKDSILGEYVLKIPWIGNIVTFAKTPLGLVALIIMPGTMIAYSEAMNIKKEIQKKFFNKNKNEETQA